MITKEEFMEGYAGRGGRTVEQLADRGLVAMECRNCDYEECEGWKVEHVKVIEMFQELGMSHYL